jgi:hypothetical protein
MRLLHNCKLATISFVENGRVEQQGGVCVDAARVLHPNPPAMQRKHRPASVM